METETRTEYRALVSKPASVLDSPGDRERGYVLEWTRHGGSRDEVRHRDWSLSHSEESRASVVKWQQRSVTLGPWTDESD